MTLRRNNTFHPIPCLVKSRLAVKAHKHRGGAGAMPLASRTASIHLQGGETHPSLIRNSATKLTLVCRWFAYSRRTVLK